MISRRRRVLVSRRRSPDGRQLGQTLAVAALRREADS